MYKRFLGILAFCNLLLLWTILCVREIQCVQLAATPAFRAAEAGMEMQVSRNSFVKWLKQVSSGQRVVDYAVLEKEKKYRLSDRDYEILLRIVQAEAGNEDEEGKMLVANVVLNRVEDSLFPDTVEAVVYQNQNGRYQFSPVSSGSINRVLVSEETRAAVEKVLAGEDMSEGALYFASRKYADTEKMRWFDTALNKLFVHGGHEFFK